MLGNQSQGPLPSFPSNASEYHAELASTSRHTEDDLEDQPVEVDPSRRYSRYAQQVGHGRFKSVYKGFDEKQGRDIAWSKVKGGGDSQLDDQQIQRIVAELSIGLDLDHANIIRCLRCWQDQDQHCVNLLTEYFTSGNLRDYRQKHKHLELKAVKKWSRQILQGLNYLHSKAPPIIHGDLRCDKIYINGHSGDVKIGDLGLATLLPRRFKPEALPNGINTENQYTQDVDIFAFGLCVLELATCKRLDSSNCQIWPTLVETIPDEECRAFIKRCLGSETRPTAAELLDDPFLTRRLIKNDSQKKVNSMSRESMTALSDTGRSVGRSLSGNSLGASVHASLRSGDLRSADFRSGDFRSNFGSEVDELDSTITCAAGTVRGEDYNFQFSGKIKEGKLSFRLNMQYEGEGEEGTGHRRTIDFAYDPDVDTPEEIATEIGNEFNLSSTDRDICAAALKEWLAKELPDSAS